ncbi:MAG: GNAT family N-acetyltransferase [Candidatus Thermoplasmatota archaeon]|nr:GNAT family N-acetyltransferase [Candidatus Thermoplasmatota archaeon]
MRDLQKDMVIRPIREEELGTLVNLWKDSGLPFRPEGRDRMDRLSQQRKDDPDLFIGAFEKGTMIGAVIASDDGRKGWINRLAVLPAFRRKGVGIDLVEESEKVLRKRERKVFAILIEGDNRASEDLFVGAGYKREDDIIYYVKRDDEAF